MSGEVKRPAVKARKAQVRLSKGSRRRNRTGNGEHRPDNYDYGSRSFRRSPAHGVSITVQIPPLRRPRPAGKAGTAVVARPRRFRPVLVVPLALLVGGAVLFGGIGGGETAKTPASQTTAAVRTEPAYRPLVPSAETVSATRYDGKRDLVSYTTTFSGVRITVSQQGLPAGFAKDPASLQKAADSIKATKRIETARGIVYVAEDDSAGNQMAVFAGEDVLLFIRTDTRLDEASWKSFVELLRSKSWKEVS